MLTILLVFAALAALMWTSIAALVARAAWKLPRLEEQDAPEPGRWPTVSLIMPARDEGAHLEAALCSKLALDYPALQLVLVDDRSTDDTGAIADRLAAEDPRLTVIHLHELPEGWLGKMHALHRGMEHATGEWVLFVDADVYFAPDILRRAISLCEARGFDFLTAVPCFKPSTPLVNLTLVGGFPLILSAAQADWVEDSSSTTALGAGTFNLVRRSAYARTPGLEWLKMEIGDDMCFGMMMKRSGARCGVVTAQEHLHLVLCQDFAELVHSIAKSSCALGRYRLLPQVLIPTLMLALDIAPWAALAVGAAHGNPLLAAMGALGGLMQVGGAVIAASVERLSVWWAAFAPLGDVVMHFIFLASGVAAHLRGGVLWRGTRYSMVALRAGTRLRFPWER